VSANTGRRRDAQRQEAVVSKPVRRPSERLEVGQGLIEREEIHARWRRVDRSFAWL
jgi:hypothetical protein